MVANSGREREKAFGQDKITLDSLSNSTARVQICSHWFLDRQCLRQEILDESPFGKVFYQNTKFVKTTKFNLVAGFPDLQSRLCEREKIEGTSWDVAPLSISLKA